MPQYYKTEKGYCYKKTQKGGKSRISVQDYDKAIKRSYKILKNKKYGGANTNVNPECVTELTKFFKERENIYMIIGWGSQGYNIGEGALGYFKEQTLKSEVKKIYDKLGEDKNDNLGEDKNDKHTFLYFGDSGFGKKGMFDIGFVFKHLYDLNEEKKKIK